MISRWIFIWYSCKWVLLVFKPCERFNIIPPNSFFVISSMCKTIAIKFIHLRRRYSNCTYKWLKFHIWTCSCFKSKNGNQQKFTCNPQWSVLFLFKNTTPNEIELCFSECNQFGSLAFTANKNVYTITVLLVVALVIWHFWENCITIVCIQFLKICFHL